VRAGKFAISLDVRSRHKTQASNADADWIHRGQSNRAIAPVDSGLPAALRSAFKKYFRLEH
jgi:hypothetical protein